MPAIQGFTSTPKGTLIFTTSGGDHQVYRSIDNGITWKTSPVLDNMNLIGLYVRDDKR